MPVNNNSEINKNAYPLGVWIAVDSLEPQFQGLLTAELPIPEGRFLQAAANPFMDLRLYSGFIAFSALSMALVFSIVFPLVKQKPDWIAALVSLIIGLGALYATMKFKAPKVPERKGLYLLEDRLIVFDNKNALVLLREDIKSVYFDRKSHSLDIIRKDGYRESLNSEFNSRYIPSTYYYTNISIAIDKWIETGEPVIFAKSDRK
jgi:hypothetical protein